MKALGILTGGLGGGGGGGGGGGDIFSDIASRGGLRFAEGGYVTGPTNAIIGEAGENEYVIPESKMDGAMSRYSAGATGSEVIDGTTSGGGMGGVGATAGGPISITTGPVMQFEGSNYVSQEEFVSGIRSAAQQGEARALRKLQQSPATRRRVGI
jgi:hypothetical protein